MRINILFYISLGIILISIGIIIILSLNKKIDLYHDKIIHHEIFKNLNEINVNNYKKILGNLNYVNKFNGL